MANNCLFDMKITGGEAEINELISMLHWKGTGVNPGLGRLFSIEMDPIEKTSVDGVFSLYISGDCANSVKSSMRDDGIRYPSLESESNRLGLVIEVFSSETGCKFQEHVLISKGQVLISDCVHYEEHFVESCGGVEKYNKLYGTDFTQDMINCNGEVCIGGFGDDYGVFKDVSQYFNSDRAKEPSCIDEQIKNASDLKQSSAMHNDKTKSTEERF